MTNEGNFIRIRVRNQKNAANTNEKLRIYRLFVTIPTRDYCGSFYDNSTKRWSLCGRIGHSVVRSK